VRGSRATMQRGHALGRERKFRAAVRLAVMVILERMLPSIDDRENAIGEDEPRIRESNTYFKISKVNWHRGGTKPSNLQWRNETLS
jgi:hypothetical protein